MQARLLNLNSGKWVIEVTPDPPDGADGHKEKDWFLSLTRPLTARMVGAALIVEVTDDDSQS